MKHLYILNPEGNKGKGSITRYIGRGSGIRDHIDLINILIDANKAAMAMLEQAQADGADVLDISGPMHVASTAMTTLRTQATSN